MFRTIVSSLAAIGLAFTSTACAQPAPQQATPQPQTAAVQDADPALWVVQDEDTTIWLFGTIHVLKPGLSWFDEAVKKAFDASSTLVLEMVEPDSATQRRVVEAKAFDPSGTPLSDQLSPTARAKFHQVLSTTGLPKAAFEKMRPWFAAISLTAAPVQKLGYQPANGPETVLTRAATEQGKKVMGLETFEGQISIFDTLSRKAQIQLLEKTVEEMPQAGETMARMVKDWAEGNPDGLAVTMNESIKDSPEVAKALLTDRNARWADWIAKRLEEPGEVFVAVGAGHLAGGDSVQAHLKKRGLTAMRVDY